MIRFNPIKCSRKILSGSIPQTPTRYFQHPIIFNKIEFKHQKFHKKIFWINGNAILSETILPYYQLSALISQLHAQGSSSSCLIFHWILLSPAESHTESHRIFSRINQESIGSCLGSCRILSRIDNQSLGCCPGSRRILSRIDQESIGCCLGSHSILSRIDQESIRCCLGS